MADRRHRAVVRRRVERGDAARPAPPRAPSRASPRRRRCARSASRPPSRRERGRRAPRRSRSAPSPPSDGCRRTRADGAPASESAARDDARLGAPDVGDAPRRRRRGVPHDGNSSSSVATGVASTQRSAPAEPARDVGRDPSTVAVLQRGLEALAPPAHRDDRAREPVRPRGLGHRASEESEPDDGEPTDHASLTPASTFLSALTRRRFSSGVPMRHAERALHPEARHRADDHALLQEPLVDVGGAPADVDEDEVGARRRVLEAERGELVAEIVPAGLDHAQALEDVRARPRARRAPPPGRASSR